MRQCLSRWLRARGIYSLALPISAALVGIYGICLEQALVARYEDAALISAALVGRYGNTSQVQAALTGRYGDTLQVLAALRVAAT